MTLVVSINFKEPDVFIVSVSSLDTVQEISVTLHCTYTWTCSYYTNGRSTSILVICSDLCLWVLSKIVPDSEGSHPANDTRVIRHEVRKHLLQ